MTVFNKHYPERFFNTYSYEIFLVLIKKKLNIQNRHSSHCFLKCFSEDTLQLLIIFVCMCVRKAQIWLMRVTVNPPTFLTALEIATVCFSYIWIILTPEVTTIQRFPIRKSDHRANQLIVINTLLYEYTPYVGTCIDNIRFGTLSEKPAQCVKSVKHSFSFYVCIEEIHFFIDYSLLIIYHLLL